MKTERLILGLLHTNCYIVYDEVSKEAAIIDPATQFHKIEAKLTELGVKIKYIILTHAHSDHINALDDVKSYTKATVCIGHKDVPALNDGDLSLSNYFRNKTPITSPDLILHEGDMLKLGNESLKILETPGHTCGSISLYYDDVVISGDTLFFESVGRTEFATSSSADLISSIKTKLYTLPDETTVYPGHGEPTTIEHEKNNNMFVW